MIEPVVPSAQHWQHRNSRAVVPSYGTKRIQYCSHRAYPHYFVSHVHLFIHWHNNLTAILDLNHVAERKPSMLVAFARRNRVEKASGVIGSFGDGVADSVRSKVPGATIALPGVTRSYHPVLFGREMETSKASETDHRGHALDPLIF